MITGARKRRETGFGLIELVVVLSLFSLLSLLLSDFLIGIIRSNSLATTRAGLQTEALLHTDAMLATLRATTTTGLHLQSEGVVGFAATPVKTVTSSGHRVWEDSMSMYYWQPDSKTLYQRSCPPAPLPGGLEFTPSRPPALTSAHLSSLFTSEGRPLSPRVTSFTLTQSGPSLALGIVLQQAAPNTRAQRFELHREVTILSP